MSAREIQGEIVIPAPKGVYQALGDANLATDYAYRAQNIRTQRGLLASAYGTSRAFPAISETPTPVETFTRFTRRNRPDDPQVFVAAGGGALYTYTMGTEGWVSRADGFLSDKWSYVTYETAGEDASVIDILILSNPADGMVVLYGNDLHVERKALHIGDGNEEVRFAVLGRYAERIWGTGAPGYPDSVFYSRPYDPFNWDGIPETPELGGGVINQPTWDGESFLALTSFGGYLLAVKPSTLFEIRGSDPASFTIHAAFGTDGPVEARTVCAERDSVFFLSEGGLGQYDGQSCRLVSRDALYETMRLRMEGTKGHAAACVAGHVYYLALCVREKEGDVLRENNTVVEYDLERGTFMLRTGLMVKDFFALGDMVYYTQADSPHEIMRYGDSASGSYAGKPMACVWETAWLDLDKGTRKRDFLLRFTAEADGEDVPLTFTLIGERGEKSRVVMLGRRRRDYRVKIQCSARRVRLRIESFAREAWRIHGGVQIVYTADEDGDG